MYHIVFVFHIVESTFVFSSVLSSIQPSMDSKYNTISIPTSMSRVVFNEILFFFLAVCWCRLLALRQAPVDSKVAPGFSFLLSFPPRTEGSLLSTSYCTIAESLGFF